MRLWCQDYVMRPTCFETEQRLMQAHPDVPLAYSYYDVIDSEGYIRSKRPDVRGAHVKTPSQCRRRISSSFHPAPGKWRFIVVLKPSFKPQLVCRL